MNNVKLKIDKEKIDILAAKDFQERKYNDRNKVLEKCFQNARNDFEKIVKMIIENYNPKRIYQWGSLLDKKHFTEISDIDIAIEGVKNAEVFFKLLAEAEEMTDFPLDIVEMESIHVKHKDMIIKKGLLVYERN